MNESVDVATDPAAEPTRPWHQSKKLDQWICFWSVPFFFSVFGLVFVPLSWMMPPRSPSTPLAEVVDFMQSHSLLIACVVLTLSFGLAPVSNACYLMQIKRMSVSPVFRYTLLFSQYADPRLGVRHIDNRGVLVDQPRRRRGAPDQCGSHGRCLDDHRGEHSW